MSNICNCPKPPGGQVVCENNQLALCIIENGEVILRCMNPPQNRFYQQYNSLNLVNWTLESITSQHRELEQYVEIQELNMLKTGYFEDFRKKVNFTLTRRLLMAIFEVENDSNYFR